MEIKRRMFEMKYRQLIEDVVSIGSVEQNRTGVKTYTRFGLSISFDFIQNRNRLPVITGKKIFYEKALGEFWWMYEGRSDLEFLHKYNVKWWDEYAVDGIINKSYGYQLRYYNGNFDQIEYVISELKKGSRRAYMTFWNPSDLLEQDLPCCYVGMNFVITGGVVNCEMTFRSSDVFLGLPYDFIVGALFLKQIAYRAELKPGVIKYSLANAHIYLNHINAVDEYLSRPVYDLPKIKSNFDIADYFSGTLIKAKLNN